MATIAEVLAALDVQRVALAANLTTMGVASTSSETLADLVPKVLLIAGGTPPPPAGYAGEVMADAPALYYPLDDAAAPAIDATGNTTAAYAEGGWPVFGAAGIGDGSTSADFPGTAGIQTTQPASLQGVSAMTVEALIRPDVVGERQIVSRDASSPRSFQFRLNANGTLSFIRIYGTVVTATTAAVFSAGVAYHVAAVCDGTDIRLYVNGALNGSPAAATGIVNPAINLPYKFGWRRDSGERWDGLLAGVAIYPSALSAARVLAHAQAAGVA